jgi:Flp pilus assembly protein TadB
MNNERDTVALAVLGKTLSEGMKVQAEAQRDVALSENATVEKIALGEQAEQANENQRDFVRDLILYAVMAALVAALIWIYVTNPLVGADLFKVVGGFGGGFAMSELRQRREERRRLRSSEGASK